MNSWHVPKIVAAFLPCFVTEQPRRHLTWAEARCIFSKIYLWFHFRLLYFYHTISRCVGLQFTFQCAVKCKEWLAFSVVVKSGVRAYPGQAVDRKGIFAFDVYLCLAESNHLCLFKKALKCSLVLFKIII